MPRIEEQIYTMTGARANSAGIKDGLRSPEAIHGNQISYFTERNRDGYQIEVTKRRRGITCLIVVRGLGVNERRAILDEILQSTYATEMNPMEAYLELRSAGGKEMWEFDKFPSIQ